MTKNKRSRLLKRIIVKLAVDSSNNGCKEIPIRDLMKKSGLSRNRVLIVWRRVRNRPALLVSSGFHKGMALIPVFDKDGFGRKMVAIQPTDDKARFKDSERTQVKKMEGIKDKHETRVQGAIENKLLTARQGTLFLAESNQ